MLDAIKLEASRFQNVLQSLRVRRGKEWTQEKTAELLNVKYRLYFGWENGEGLPSPDNLKKIVAIFGLNQEEEEALYRAAARVPSKIRHLPFPPNPFFTGRKTYLEQLRQFLQEDCRVAITQPVSISGLGGIGKTQLALAYAYSSYPKVYRAVLWVNAADRTTLQAGYDYLAQEILGLPEQNEREPHLRVQAVKQWLDDHTNWLLIMDNADDLQLARSFFPEANHGHILLTTRSQIVGNIAARQIEIDKMVPEDGLLFLLRRSHVLEDDANLDTVAADICESALHLVELLGGHPLALDHAGAYIEETGESFTDYINLYNEERRPLLNPHGTLESDSEGAYSEHPDTVVTTFELCFKKAHERHPLATDILHFCVFLQPDAIPAELFRHDDSFKLDRAALREGIIALRRYSLIQRNVQEKTFSMHRLVQAVLIDAMSPDLQKQGRERVVRALNTAFPEVDFKERRRCERLLLHVLACADWTEDELTPTAEGAMLFHKAGIYTSEQHQYLKAEALHSRVLSICEQHLGAEQHDTASALNNVAGTYLKQGKYEQAEHLYKQVLAIRENHLGTEHPDTAQSLHILACIYNGQGKYEQAELSYRRAFNILEKHLGIEHRAIAVLLFGLKALLEKQGKHEQARSLDQRARRVLEQQLEATHPLLQMTDAAYANLLRSLGIGLNAEAAALEANDEPTV